MAPHKCAEGVILVIGKQHDGRLLVVIRAVPAACACRLLVNHSCVFLACAVACSTGMRGSVCWGHSECEADWRGSASCVVLGGLVSSTLLNMLVVPAGFMMWCRGAAANSKKEKERLV